MTQGPTTPRSFVRAGGAFTERDPSSDVLCRPWGTPDRLQTGGSWLAARFLAETTHRALTLGTRTTITAPGEGHDDERSRTPWSYREFALFERSGEQRVFSFEDHARHRHTFSSVLPRPPRQRANRFRTDYLEAISAPNRMRPIDFCHPFYFTEPSCTHASLFQRVPRIESLRAGARGDRAVHAADTHRSFDLCALRSASAHSYGIGNWAIGPCRPNPKLGIRTNLGHPCRARKRVNAAIAGRSYALRAPRPCSRACS